MPVLTLDHFQPNPAPEFPSAAARFMAIVHNDNDGILKNIFMNGPRSAPPGQWGWTTAHESFRRTLVTVCRKWRTEAFSIPALWVHIGLFSGLPIPWIERVLISSAGTLPIHIDLFLSSQQDSPSIHSARSLHFHAMWDKIAPLIPRCSHLALEVYGNEMTLEVLRRITPSPFTRLTHLQIHLNGDDCITPIPSPEPPLEESSDLPHGFDDIQDDEENVVKILGAGSSGPAQTATNPHLTVLVLLDFCFPSVSPIFWLGPHLSTISITHLTIIGCCYGVEAILKFATRCPRLTHLEYTPDSDVSQWSQSQYTLPSLLSVELGNNKAVSHFFQRMVSFNLQSITFGFLVSDLPHCRSRTYPKLMEVSFPGGVSAHAMNRFLRVTRVSLVDFQSQVDSAVLGRVSTVGTVRLEASQLSPRSHLSDWRKMCRGLLGIDRKLILYLDTDFGSLAERQARSNRMIHTRKLWPRRVTLEWCTNGEECPLGWA